MFDRLIVSAKDRRRGKTGKVFFFTSLCYCLAIASALVISVTAATPALEDTSKLDRFIPVIPAPTHVPKGSTSQRPRGKLAAAQRQTSIIYNPAPLETVSDPATRGKLPTGVLNPPNISTDIGGDGDFGGPVGHPDGDPLAPAGPTSVPGGDGKGEAPPVPPQRTQPRVEPQPQVSQKPMRLASTVLSGKAIERKTPVYPHVARQARLEGTVTVEVVISVEGRVESARALGGHPLLVSAAVEAARGWRFQPTLLNNVAVRVTGLITFNFTLR